VFEKYFILSLRSIAILLERGKFILFIQIRAYRYYTWWMFLEIKV